MAKRRRVNRADRGGFVDDLRGADQNELLVHAHREGAVLGDGLLGVGLFAAIENIGPAGDMLRKKDIEAGALHRADLGGGLGFVEVEGLLFHR